MLAMAWLASKKGSRLILAVVAVLSLSLGTFLIGVGSNLPHIYSASALNFNRIKTFPLAVLCPSGSNSSDIPSSACFPSEQYPDNGWQLRWGSLGLPDPNDHQGALLWREYWYTTYRWEQTFSTDYDSNPIGPECSTGVDTQPDGTPCQIGTVSNPSGLGAPAYNWIGFIASRTFKAGFTNGFGSAGGCTTTTLGTSCTWPVGQKTHVHVELTFDDYIRLQFNLDPNGQVNAWTGWQPVLEGNIANFPLGQPVTGGAINCNTGIQPLCWDYDMNPGDTIRVRVIWQQFTGSALVDNGWNFVSGSIPQCVVSQDILAYDLIDKTHGTQSDIHIHDAKAQYNIDPSFTIRGRVIQPACSGLITRVPMSLQRYNPNYNHGVNFSMQYNSDGSYSVDINQLPAKGNYYLDIGVETGLGSQWALSAMRFQYVTPSVLQVNMAKPVVSSGFTGWLSDPVRIMGFGLIVIFVISAAALIGPVTRRRG